MPAWIDQLERKTKWRGISDLTTYILVGQGIFFVACLVKPEFFFRCMLIPKLVLNGEVWRIFTFFFVPADLSLLFVLLSLYVFNFLGNSLENYLGDFKYTLFFLIPIVSTVLLSFLAPYNPYSNIPIITSVFLAFTYLNPNYTFLLFFILPVRCFWLGVLTWGGILVSILAGDLGTKISAITGISGFLVFFGYDLFKDIKHWVKKKKWKESFTHIRKR
jgi:membrane associated rhomboid family serine protease